MVILLAFSMVVKVVMCENVAIASFSVVSPLLSIARLTGSWFPEVSNTTDPSEMRIEA